MRFTALGSLRGLAALVVVVHHHLLTLPAFFPTQVGQSGWAAWLTFSPLHLLWAGGEAVSFFFLLSGFVLTLPVWRGEPLDMMNFVVRRVWRVWVPFIVAVTLAALAFWRLGWTPVLGTSVWFENIWKEAGVSAYVQHVLMLGRMDEGLTQWAFLPVVWSLKWEMWLSLLLPVVVLLARQHAVFTPLLCVLMLAAHYFYGTGDIATNLLRYLAMFVLGAWLSRHHDLAARTVARWPVGVPAAVLAVTLLLIPVQWYGWTADMGWVRTTVNDTVTVFGSALLVALALGWAPFRTWLERPALQWLGRVSYSVYLYHTLVITLVVRLGTDRLPVPWLLLLSFALTFPVAEVMYRLVERPAVTRSERLKRRVVSTRTVAAD
ncbi:peptidoglycan/LPS O-acetylase OafA/YrhL [Deinococcus metalli]|uniref:Acyltransferase n=1 Tax=Deinococcus metalli TaxID=1141878 RepID=A0A7W8KC18_9DEIO|nr:acyltransferase [Deinococcus metalli]MBB5375407.1 peptidoglycan/LPS O-acetylase OafA/YrhL [Deinococcus metalli]GHF29512.1 acyltransferase [Deinococcus metalli]